MKEKRLSFKLILRQLEAFAEKLSKNKVVALIIQNKKYLIQKYCKWRQEGAIEARSEPNFCIWVKKKGILSVVFLDHILPESNPWLARGIYGKNKTYNLTSVHSCVSRTNS